MSEWPWYFEEFDDLEEMMIYVAVGLCIIDSPYLRTIPQSQTPQLFMAEPEIICIPGEIAPQAWWGRAWLAALEDRISPERAQRGYAYSRTYPVYHMEVFDGFAYANLPSSLPWPYETTIQVQPFSASTVGALEALLHDNPSYVERILRDELPTPCEALLREWDESFIPRGAELRYTCTCRAHETPCIHAVALHYILAGHIDTDPALLWRLRGQHIETVLAPFIPPLPDDLRALAENRDMHPRAKPLAVQRPYFWKRYTRHFDPPPDYVPNENQALVELGPPPGNMGDVLDDFYDFIRAEALAHLHSIKAAAAQASAPDSAEAEADAGASDDFEADDDDKGAYEADDDEAVYALDDFEADDLENEPVSAPQQTSPNPEYDPPTPHWQGRNPRPRLRYNRKY
ncbi:MAG: hypothetical protein ACLFTK_13300 [Anaerolineales bacterium]